MALRMPCMKESGVTIPERMKLHQGEPLEFDPEDEAYWAIDRGINNHALDTGAYHRRTPEVDAAHRDHLARTQLDTGADERD